MSANWLVLETGIQSMPSHIPVSQPAALHLSLLPEINIATIAPIVCFTSFDYGPHSSFCVIFCCQYCYDGCFRMRVKQQIL